MKGLNQLSSCDHRGEVFEVSLEKGYGVKLQSFDIPLQCLGLFLIGFEKTKLSFECTEPTLKQGF